LALGAGYLLYRRARPPNGGIEIQRSLTIHGPRDDVFRRWHEPETQPLVWSHFAELTNVTPDGARWRVQAPLGRALEWETRIVEDEAPKRVRWEAVDGDVRNEGTVEFRDAPRDFGTELTLRVRLDPPPRPLGGARVLLLPAVGELVLAKALRRFKSLVETGEIPSTERNPNARKD
jgi:uncharacterized membrane protein